MYIYTVVDLTTQLEWLRENPGAMIEKIHKLGHNAKALRAWLGEDCDISELNEELIESLTWDYMDTYKIREVIKNVQ